MATKDRPKAPPTPTAHDPGPVVPPLDVPRAVLLRDELARLARDVRAAEAEITAAHNRRRDLHDRAERLRHELLTLVLGDAGLRL